MSALCGIFNSCVFYYIKNYGRSISVRIIFLILWERNWNYFRSLRYTWQSALSLGYILCSFEGTVRMCIFYKGGVSRVLCHGIFLQISTNLRNSSSVHGTVAAPQPWALPRRRHCWKHELARAPVCSIFFYVYIMYYDMCEKIEKSYRRGLSDYHTAPQQQETVAVLDTQFRTTNNAGAAARRSTPFECASRRTVARASHRHNGESKWGRDAPPAPPTRRASIPLNTCYAIRS